MPELRKDPLVDRWVIIASERGARPSDFRLEAEPSVGSGFCPFCRGNEDKTPPTVFSIDSQGAHNGHGPWAVRVVPNKYPALMVEGELNRRGLGLYDMMNGVGAHEVIVESPDHQFDIAEGPAQQTLWILEAFRERVTDLGRDPRFHYALLFRNHRAAAGASLSHPHSQLIAIAITPQALKDKLTGARNHYLARDRCLFCDIILQEQALGARVVTENDHFIVLSPFAARFPFELNVFPKRHCHDFTRMMSSEMGGLVDILHRSLGALKAAVNDPPYNMIMHNAPYPVPRPGRPEYWGTIQYDFHWHLEIIPRVTRMAGFEWGTGFYINPVSPEAATQCLREILG